MYDQALGLTLQTMALFIVRAVKNCSYVLHTASPFPASNPHDEMELIKPAVEGTKNVLEACAKTKGCVKRVVLTSSIAAAYGEQYVT